MKKEMRPIELPEDIKRGMISNDMRNKDLLLEVKELVETSHKQHTENYNKVKKEIEGFSGRLETVEADKDVITNGPGRTLATSSETTAPFKTFHGREGKVFELPSTVKLQTAMPQAEKPPVSFDRFMGAFAAAEHCKDLVALDYYRSMKNQMETQTTGMNIPQSYLPEWIDWVRSQMVLNQAGMTTIIMNDKILNASAVATDPGTTWHAESANINVDNPTFEARALIAKTLAVRCQASLECTQDSPDFGRQLIQVMSRAMAVELDRVGLVGTGGGSPSTNAPQGILGTSGVNQVTSVGSIADYTKMLSGVRLLLDSNVPLEIATGFAIMSPGVWLAHESLATGISSDKTQLARPQSLQSTRFLVTTNGLDVGSPATSTIFMGDFRDLVLGIRMQANIEALKLTTYASNLLIEFIGYLRADYMVRRPSSFVTLEGVAPAA